MKHNHRYHKKFKKNHPWRTGWAKVNKDLRAVTEWVFEGKTFRSFRFPAKRKHHHGKYAI